MKAFLFLSALGLFYAVLYFLNSKTPIPEGCEELIQNCHGCAISSCGLHPSQREEGISV
ncbi:MAG: hypothetical protein GX845_04410 [Erysipelothrix sp.]|jgi:hypothetical protein|nr:hypothetical protein [Erysipelothrix sp.]